MMEGPQDGSNPAAATMQQQEGAGVDSSSSSSSSSGLIPPPSPGEDAKVRSLAASVEAVVLEGEETEKAGSSRGGSASASPPPPGSSSQAPSTPAGIGSSSSSTSSPAPTAQLLGTPATATKGGGTSSSTTALVAELCTVLLKQRGHSSSLASLPEELVAAHCQGLVRVLRETEALRQHIEREGCMEGDAHQYMKVCESNEGRATQGKIRVLQRLRQDFDDKHAALKKELRGLREQITTLRGRAQAAAWPQEKKTAILAALLRFEGLHERELKALQLTESATEELRKARAQLPKLAEEVDGLLELMAKMRRVSKMLARLGMPNFDEGKMEGVWAQMLDMLKWRPIADILEETAKALKDLKDVKLSEAKRRHEQQLRLLALCGTADDADFADDADGDDDDHDAVEDEEDEEEMDGGEGEEAPAAAPLPPLQPIAESDETRSQASGAGSSTSPTSVSPLPAVPPTTDDAAAAPAGVGEEFEACPDSWAAIFPEHQQKPTESSQSPPSSSPSATSVTSTTSSSTQNPQQQPRQKQQQQRHKPGAGFAIDDEKRRRQLYGAKTRPPELGPAKPQQQRGAGLVWQRVSMYEAGTAGIGKGANTHRSLQPSGSTDSLGSVSSLGSVRSVGGGGGGFDRPTASSRQREQLRGGVASKARGGVGGVKGGQGRVGGVGEQPRSQSFYLQRGPTTKL